MLLEGKHAIVTGGSQGIGTAASLELAKLRLEQGDTSGAEVQLRWALENSSDPSLSQIARLRLARVLLDELPLKQAAALAARITGEKKNRLYQRYIQMSSFPPRYAYDDFLDS